jgi:hypothetical protein
MAGTGSIVYKSVIALSCDYKKKYQDLKNYIYRILKYMKQSDQRIFHGDEKVVIIHGHSTKIHVNASRQVVSHVHEVFKRSNVQGIT